MRKLATIVLSLMCATCVKTITVRPPSYGPPANACESAPADLDVVTYNTGLGPGIVSYASARAPHVIDAVASTPFDVLCLQEVWTDGDRDAIIARLGLPPENVAFVRTAGLGETGEDRCSDGDLDRLSACTAERCRGVPEEDLTMCALSRCESALRGIFFRNRECLNCLAAMSGHSEASIRRHCTTRGMSRIYGGRNGIILASRWPLLDKEAIMLPTSNANRVAILARVDVPGRGEVELACTHLSSSQAIPPYHSGYDDWDEEKAAQLEIVSRRLAERAAGRPQFFIGDHNFGGGDGASIEDESGWVWYRAHELGFSDPAAYVTPRLCSICSGNTFVGTRPRSKLIDHVLLRDPPGGIAVEPTCGERMYEGTVTVPGYEGSPVSTSLSDHYGIRMKFRLR